MGYETVWCYQHKASLLVVKVTFGEAVWNKCSNFGAHLPKDQTESCKFPLLILLKQAFKQLCNCNLHRLPQE